jgi:hypothetical protein
MSQAVRINLRSEPLRDDVNEIVLKVLGDSRNESDTDCRGQPQGNPLEKLSSSEKI